VKFKELREAWHSANWTKTPAEGDEMARRLRKLDERHSLSGDCPDCTDSYQPPCPDRRILDGEDK